MPEFPQITLFRDVNFGGRAVTLWPCGTSSLGKDYNFNDQASSIRVTGGTWLLYDDDGYSGNVYVVTPGEYPYPDRWGGANDRLSSLRPLPGNPGDEMILLFQDGNYGGRMLTFTGPQPNFVDIDFNDLVSSVIVLGGNWSLYKDINFTGTGWRLDATSGPLRNGFIPSAGSFFDNDQVSSIQPTP